MLVLETKFYQFESDIRYYICNMSFRDYLENKSSLGVIECRVDDVYEERCKNRLREVIEEYRDLAVIDNWDLIKNDREITSRLSRAYEVLHNVVIPKRLRCVPCEMEALCAIREICGGPVINFGMQEFGPKGDLKEIGENIRKRYKEET